MPHKDYCQCSLTKPIHTLEYEYLRNGKRSQIKICSSCYLAIDPKETVERQEREKVDPFYYT
jgi:hypothetical protein